MAHVLFSPVNSLPFLPKSELIEFIWNEWTEREYGFRCVCMFFFAFYPTFIASLKMKQRKTRVGVCSRRKIYDDVKHLKAINRMYYSNLMFSLSLTLTHNGSFIGASMHAHDLKLLSLSLSLCVDYVLSLLVCLFFRVCGVYVVL